MLLFLYIFLLFINEIYDVVVLFKNLFDLFYYKLHLQVTAERLLFIKNIYYS